MVVDPRGSFQSIMVMNSKPSRDLSNVRLQLKTRMTRSRNPRLHTDEEMDELRYKENMLVGQLEQTAETRKLKVSVDSYKVETKAAIDQSETNVVARVNTMEANMGSKLDLLLSRHPDGLPASSSQALPSLAIEDLVPVAVAEEQSVEGEEKQEEVSETIIEETIIEEIKPVVEEVKLQEKPEVEEEEESS